VPTQAHFFHVKPLTVRRSNLICGLRDGPIQISKRDIVSHGEAIDFLSLSQYNPDFVELHHSAQTPEKGFLLIRIVWK
jgi:hypothetical protein